jgi:hypothetical protein
MFCQNRKGERIMQTKEQFLEEMGWYLRKSYFDRCCERIYMNLEDKIKTVDEHDKHRTGLDTDDAGASERCGDIHDIIDWVCNNKGHLELGKMVNYDDYVHNRFMDEKAGMDVCQRCSDMQTLIEKTYRGKYCYVCQRCADGIDRGEIDDDFYVEAEDEEDALQQALYQLDEQTRDYPEDREVIVAHYEIYCPDFDIDYHEVSYELERWERILEGGYTNPDYCKERISELKAIMEEEHLVLKTHAYRPSMLSKRAY